jgi:hypothetical protein
MTTGAKFPIAPGGLVTVSCNPGHVLTGNKVVTCVKDREFEYEGQLVPTCVKGKFR